MGVTITVALAVWLSGSLIEYRIIKKYPKLERLFHGFQGMLLSVAIGAGVGFLLGASTGAGFILGQTIGLATNNFTYQLYKSLDKGYSWSKERVEVTRQGMEKHRHQITQARKTIGHGVKILSLMVYGFLWVVGRPSAMYDWCHNRKLNWRPLP